jgi:hypothetical protein
VSDTTVDVAARGGGAGPFDGVPGVGDVVDEKYAIEEILGAGGMGVVVAARHLNLGERVAIKFLLPKVAKDPETVERFMREARASARIKNEHVVRVMDAGRLDSGAPSNGTVYAPDGGYTKPNFDGNDLWTVDPSSVSDAGPPDASPWDSPQFASATGYVNGGFFVIRNFALRLGLGDLAFDLSNAVLTGQIIRATAQNRYFIARGTIAARVTASSFLRGITALRPGSGNSLCPESPSGYFAIIKNAVCPSRDVQSDPQASPETPCDALSFGITFEAYEARIAEVRGRPPIVSPCVDSGAGVFECPPP